MNVFDLLESLQDPDETDKGHVCEGVRFGLNGTACFARPHYKS